MCRGRVKCLFLGCVGNNLCNLDVGIGEGLTVSEIMNWIAVFLRRARISSSVWYRYLALETFVKGIVYRNL